VLLSYPRNFYPESEQDIYDYTKAVCDATSLGIILFPMFLWGFSRRIHDNQMAALRKGLLDAGLTPTAGPFREFFTGRNPA